MQSATCRFAEEGRSPDPAWLAGVGDCDVRTNFASGLRTILEGHTSFKCTLPWNYLELDGRPVRMCGCGPHNCGSP
jgi:hypothetical protein